MDDKEFLYFRAFLATSLSNFGNNAFNTALLIGSAALCLFAIFGAAGIFVSPNALPGWLAHAVGTIGHSECLAMFMSGSVLGGLGAISGIILAVKNCRSFVNHDYWTPLMQAAANGQTMTVQALINQGAEIDEGLRSRTFWKIFFRGGVYGSFPCCNFWPD